MESGSNLLFLSIIFGLLSLFSIVLKELKESGKKVLFEQIIPHSKQFIRATFIFLTADMGLLIYYLINSDFSINYVWQHTSKDLPVAYKISALWTGESGSLMFLSWIILSIVLMISEQKGQSVRFIRKIQIITLTVGIIFLALTFIVSPFAKINGNNIPEDGAGLNPILVNKWMILHPPGIFIPYGILVVVFASAIVFILDRNKEWESFSRPFARAAWIVLGAGMVAGIIWSYEVWENYWIWDPAFVSILMTWLLLTAYLHSSVMYRKNWIKLLAPALAINSFVFSMYSTYIIRSGTIRSAHSFGDSSQSMLLLFSVLLISIISESVILRSYFSEKNNRKNNYGHEIFSKKNLYYAMIIILSGLSFIFFWGLTASLLFENLGISISNDLYREWSYPLTIGLLAILGICMFAEKGKKLVSCVIFSMVFLIVIILIKPLDDLYASLSIFCLIFAGTGSVYRIIKSSNVKGIKNKFIFSSSHIVHFGIVIMLTGILMTSYATSETVLFMNLREKKAVEGYEIQLNDLVLPEENKLDAIITKTGIYTIFKDGIKVDSGEARFREINGELITEPLIYRGIFADVNIRYQGTGSQRPIFISIANVRVIPGMSILWAGCFLVITGLVPLFIFREK